jgi:hypothetical protein
MRTRRIMSRVFIAGLLRFLYSRDGNYSSPKKMGNQLLFDALTRFPWIWGHGLSSGPSFSPASLFPMLFRLQGKKR